MEVMVLGRIFRERLFGERPVRRPANFTVLTSGGPSQWSRLWLWPRLLQWLRL